MARVWDQFPQPVILGVPVRAMRMEDVARCAEQTIEARGQMHIGVINAAKVVNMRKDAALREAVLASDLILADGAGVVWAGRLLGAAVPERVAGIDLMIRLLELADRRRYGVYFLGASEDVNQSVTRTVEERYPGVRVAGRRNGYYAQQEEDAVVADIRRSRADILFVAMTPPKKEIFMARWAEALDVPVTHGVGGAFDVLAGRVKRAPALWQKLGLEWLYRVVQEPRRMWRRYLVTNTMFAGLVLTEGIRRLLRRPARSPVSEPASAKVSKV